MTRHEHKTDFKAQLMKADRIRILEIRDKAAKVVAHNIECWTRQNDNGMNVSSETLRKNNARAMLEIECCDEVLKDADANLQKYAFAADCR